MISPVHQKNFLSSFFRPVFCAKICRPSSFSQMFSLKKLSPCSKIGRPSFYTGRDVQIFFSKHIFEGGSGILESDHPYKNNYAAERVQTWIVSTKCPYVRLNFTSFKTEAPFDYLEILDDNGRLLHNLTGDWKPSMQRMVLHVSSFSLKLITDMSEARHGFKIYWNCGRVRFKRMA